MKILLINPPYVGNINTWTPDSTNQAIGKQPPLGLAYLAAVLKENGYPVVILDINALDLREGQLRKKIQDIRPDVVGITVMTLLAQNAIKVARLIKEVDSNIKVVLGGSHLSIFPKETLSFDCVDYAIYGEGEYAFLELIKKIDEHSLLDTVAGLIYRKNGKIIINKVVIIDDLDKLPHPAVGLLPLERYSLANALHPFASIVTTRGCPWRCGFCLRDPMNVKLRLRQPRLVVDEIQERIEKFGAREINICNDSLTANRAHIEGICNELLRRKIKIRWQGPSRIDTVTPDLLKLMAKSGCHTLRYGVESGSQEILNRMNKGITLSQIRNAFKWTKEAGIEIMAYFMLGYIGETAATMQQTIDFAKKLSPDGAIFAIATPLPHTELFQEAAAAGIVDSQYWINFSLCRETRRINYLIADAEYWIKKALWSFYFRPTYILQRIKKVTSWNIFKKYLFGAWAFLRFRMYRREKIEFNRRLKDCL